MPEKSNHGWILNAFILVLTAAGVVVAVVNAISANERRVEHAHAMAEDNTDRLARLRDLVDSLSSKVDEGCRNLSAFSAELHEKSRRCDILERKVERIEDRIFGEQK